MATPAAILTKCCSKCGEAKPLEDFPPRASSRDGLHTWCRPCKTAYHRAYTKRWRVENSARHRKNARRQYAGRREQRRQEARDYAEAHREELNAKAREYGRRAYAEDPGRFLDRMHRRRVATSAPHLADLINRLKGLPCRYCGATSGIEIDHVLPLARGGQHVAGNLAPACGFCNRSKKDRLPWEWFRWTGV